eukprot:SAG31_NODE_4380_length_3288_cov_3.080903_2_plen_190_part_00
MQKSSSEAAAGGSNKTKTTAASENVVVQDGDVESELRGAKSMVPLRISRLSSTSRSHTGYKTLSDGRKTCMLALFTTMIRNNNLHHPFQTFESVKHYRIYSQLTDFACRSYFHRELDEEAKRLLSAGSGPKKLDAAAAAEIERQNSKYEVLTLSDIKMFFDKSIGRSSNCAARLEGQLGIRQKLLKIKT